MKGFITVPAKTYHNGRDYGAEAFEPTILATAVISLVVANGTQRAFLTTNMVSQIYPDGRPVFRVFEVNAPVEEVRQSMQEALD